MILLASAQTGTAQSDLMSSPLTMRSLHQSCQSRLNVFHSVLFQGNNDNNTTVLYHHSTSATAGASPSVTPRQTDDEVKDLPDVTAERKKRRWKRQSSKEPQSNGQC